MGPNATRTLARDAAFNLTRLLPAPSDAVWRAWTEPERLNCWWGPTRHPWEPDWPLLSWTEIALEPVEDGTCLGITWIPADATPAEIRCFEQGHDNCRAGWTGTLDQLEAFLAQEERST